MSDLTPDPLWDGQGSDSELERLERLLSPLKSTQPLPPLPARNLPSWVWVLAAGLLFGIGSFALIQSGAEDVDDPGGAAADQGAVTEVVSTEAVGTEPDERSEPESQAEGERRDDQGTETVEGSVPAPAEAPKREMRPPLREVNFDGSAPGRATPDDETPDSGSWSIAGAVPLGVSHEGDIRNPQPSPSGTKIAYEVAYPAEKRIEVHLAELSAQGVGSPTRLEPERMARAVRPGWGPPATHLFGWAPPGGAHDYAYTVVDPLGSQSIYVNGWPALIDGGQNKGPVWDPTAARFVFMSNRTGNGDLYLWDEGEELQLTYDDVHAEIHPAWSPDGEKVAYVRAGKAESQILVLDVNAFSSVQLFNFRGKDSSHPSWSPDGSKLAFLSNKAMDSVMQFGLWVVDPRPGSTPRNIGPSIRLPLRGACDWTPDGEAVVAVLDDPDRGDPIALFPIDGGEPRILATGTVNNRDPRLTVLDGQWRLHFTSQGRTAEAETTWQTLWVYDIPR